MCYVSPVTCHLSPDHHSIQLQSLLKFWIQYNLSDSWYIAVWIQYNLSDSWYIAVWIQYNLSDSWCLAVWIQYNHSYSWCLAGWTQYYLFWSYEPSGFNTVQFDRMSLILCVWKYLYFVLTITSTYFILVWSNYDCTIKFAYFTECFSIKGTLYFLFVFICTHIIYMIWIF